MQVEIEAEHIDVTQALENHVNHQLERIDRRWGDRITRIQMHLKDINGPGKGGVDKQCVLEARPAGMNPVVTETLAENAYDAINQAAHKLERALEHAVNKRRQ